MSNGIPGDAIDRHGVAEILEVTAESVSRYASAARRSPVGRGLDIPLPVAYVGRSPLWSETEIREWSEGRPGHGHGLGGRYKYAHNPKPNNETGN